MASRYVGVKRRLIELWHQSLAAKRKISELDGIFELKQSGEAKSRLHCRNEPLTVAPSGMGEQRKEGLPQIFSLLLAIPAMSLSCFDAEVRPKTCCPLEHPE